MKFPDFGTSLRLLVGLVVVLGGSARATAAVTAESVIAKAREHIGGDAALDAVKSIRFSGSILMADGTNGDIEILVSRPMQQRVTISIGSVREVTALSGYDGWRRVENLLNAADWELTLLDARQIQRLRANTVENIGFFKGLPGNAPEVRLVAEETIDGVPCAKIAFNYSRRIQFLRTFEIGTGRLLRTETDDGGVLTENGEIYVQGVRFPKELKTETAAGSSRVIFTKIELNQPFEDKLFDVPTLMPGGRSQR